MASLTKKEKIADELRQLVTSGEIKRGTRIRQNELADRFDASITPVREALLQLQAEGLLESRPGRGFQVSKLDLEQIKGIYIARRLIEPYAMQRASYRISPRDLTQAKRANEDMARGLAEGDHPAVREANHRFHFQLYERTDVPSLVRLIDGLWATFPWDILHSIGTGTSNSIDEHSRLLEALEARDSPAIHAAADYHIARSYRTLALHFNDAEADFHDAFDLDAD